MVEHFTFFWHGPFSQWYPSRFIIEGITYSCAEQYMMYKKALLFNDVITANKILRETSPKKQKSLGRKVKWFDPVRWEQVAQEIVYAGNYNKFTQNADLMVKLLSSNGTLVEASPFDTVWGIGLSKDDPKALSRATWQGTNWLGEILTNLKQDLVNEGWAVNGISRLSGV